MNLLDQDITAANVISVTKAHVARYGVSGEFLSDNGPQYISQEFVNFAKEYDFKLITRSPYYARATGKAESCVKEAKKMLKNSGNDLLSSAAVSLWKNKVHFADVCNVVGSIRATSSKRTR